MEATQQRNTETARIAHPPSKPVRAAGAVVEAVAGRFKDELSAADLGQLVKAAWALGRKSTNLRDRSPARPATTPAGTVSDWTIPLHGGLRRVLEDRGAWRTAVRLLIGAPIATEILPVALLSATQAHLSRAGRPRKQP
mgnify:CR=1 FL=1